MTIGWALWGRVWSAHRLQMIEEEGVNALDSIELRNACMERGMGNGTDDEMREALQRWIDLSMRRMRRRHVTCQA